MDESHTKIEPCLVCGGKTKYLHYQIASCRACATFFKRSSELGRVYKCKLGTKTCTLSENNGQRMCRYCRLQRCKQLGMKLENGRHVKYIKNGASTSASNGNDIPDCPRQQQTSVIMKPFTAVEVFPYTRIKIKDDGKIIIDMSPVEEAIKEILEQTTTTPIVQNIKLTFMQQLHYGFSLFQPDFKPIEPVILSNVFDRYALIKHHEKFMLILAKILMHCDRFVELDYNDKRHYSSILYFGTSKENEYKLLLDERIALDYNDCQFCIKDIDEQVFRKTIEHWLPWRNKNFKFLNQPMKELQMSLYELAFLYSQLLWNVQDDESLSPNAIKTAEQMTEQNSMELHNYYVYEKGLVTYSNRLIKLIKLIEAARDVVRTKHEIFLMERVFDSIDFTVVESVLYDSRG